MEHHHEIPTILVSFLAPTGERTTTPTASPSRDRIARGSIAALDVQRTQRRGRGFRLAASGHTRCECQPWRRLINFAITEVVENPNIDPENPGIDPEDPNARSPASTPIYVGAPRAWLLPDITDPVTIDG